MSHTTVSSRSFNRDVSKMKKAAEHGPVFVTDRGHVAHVLLSIEQYRNITGEYENICDLLAMPEAQDIEFSAPRLADKLTRAADFS